MIGKLASELGMFSSTWVLFSSLLDHRFSCQCILNRWSFHSFSIAGVLESLELFQLKFNGCVNLSTSSVCWLFFAYGYVYPQLLVMEVLFIVGSCSTTVLGYMEFGGWGDVISFSGVTLY